MKDLIEALQIFLKYMDDVYSPTNCSHDLLYVACPVPPSDMAPTDVARLDELGFLWELEVDGGWGSFRFGSC